MDRIDRLIPTILAGVILFHLGLASIWIRIDRTPAYWDEAWYLYQGAVQHETLRHGSLADWYSTWTDLDRTRPSLVPTLTVPFFALLGVSDDAALLVNLVGLAALLLATYGLGTALDGRRTGLLAALLVGSYPVLIGLSHILLVELVMVALVAATLFALWQSDGFRHRGWTVAAGLLMGLGALTKVFYVIFVAGPWLVMVVWSVRRHQGRWTLSHLGNLLLSPLIAVVMASFWYVANFEPMLRRTIDSGVGTTGAQYGPAAPLHWTSLTAYFLRFVGTGISLVGLLALLAGIVGLVIAALQSRRDEQHMQPLDWHALLFLASSILPGYLLFTSLNNQDLKHVTGILPGVAVLSGWGITKLARRFWPAVAGVLLVATLLLALVATLPGSLETRRLPLPALGSELLLLYPAQPAALDTRYARPDPAPWPLHEILGYALQVGDLESLRRDRAHVAVIPNYPGLEEHALRFEAYRLRMPLQIATALPANLADQDVLIHKTGDWGWLPSAPAVEAVLAELASPDSGFSLMPATFALPDGSEAIIYGRKPSPLLSESPTPAQRQRVEFGNSARFLGFDAEAGESTSDAQTVVITYYWESLAPTATDMSVFVHLLDPESGEIVAQDDHPLFPDVYPTSMWQAGRFLFERRLVRVPATFRGPALMLRLGLYDQQGRLPVTSAGEALDSDGTFADMGLIKLGP